jgi:hypothetical protein
MGQSEPSRPAIQLQSLFHISTGLPVAAPILWSVFKDPGRAEHRRQASVYGTRCGLGPPRLTARSANREIAKSRLTPV